MKRHTHLTAAIVAASAFALSGAVLASPGQSGHHGERHAQGYDKGGEFFDRHERLAAMLELDESQQAAFGALRESRQADRAARQEQRQEMRRQMLGASVPEQMRLRAERMQGAAERLSERAETMATFYETLDDRQRRMIDRMGMKRHEGHSGGHSSGKRDGHHVRGGCQKR
ncbi:MAG: Spy/CpxP family protein refolding chaperone [Pseudomonadota bacterium]